MSYLKIFKQIFFVCWVSLTMLTSALAWEKGTHAFIADKLKKADGPYNIEEMYGAMAPDVFNYLFSLPRILYRDYLHDQTHHHFLKVQQAIKF
ncbi:MAG: hypothetical protein N3B16_12560 [Candidatus Aminicenantes bacterium]|nr:hypothetical protein [Candidatus Aminicenantes bacterium]